MGYQTYKLDFSGFWNEASWAQLIAESGIYCIYVGTFNVQERGVFLREIVYIGESKNVRDRVLESPQNRRDIWVKQLDSDEELWASCAKISPRHARERTEAAMIFHHQPCCNIEYKKNFPFDRTTVRISGMTNFLSTSFTV